MSRKLLLSLSAIAVIGVVGFIAQKSGISGLRSSVVRPAVEIPAYSCAYYIPLNQSYADLAWNSFAGSYDEATGTYGSDPEVTDEGLVTQDHGLVPFCTPEQIAQYGSIDENGLFVPYGTDDESDDDTGAGDEGSDNDSGTGGGNDKPVSQLTLLLNAWNDAKTELASLEAELKTLTDSQKTLTERKAVLEKKTGTDSITAIQTRLTAVEKELTAQVNNLYKYTKLRSADEYEPAKAQALADFDVIAAEMRPLEAQLANLTNNDLKSLTVDLAKLKADLATLAKIKPQTTQTKTDITNKNKEITAKNAEITAKNKEITAKKAEIAKVQTRKTAAQNKYNTLKSYETKYIYPFRTKMSALDKEKTTLSLKLETLTTELADIKTKLGDRLPALPQLINNQKTLVTQAEKAYKDYVATLPTGGAGNGTGNGECDTTTGEGCSDDVSKEKIDCEKDGTMIWDEEAKSCGPIVTRDGEEVCQEPVDAPEQLPQGSTCCIGSYSSDFQGKIISDKFMSMSCDSSAVVPEADIASLDSVCSADTSRLNVISYRHSCSAFKNRASTEIIQYLRRLKNLDSALYMDLGCNPFRNMPSEPGRLVLDELIALNRAATVTISGNQNYGLSDKSKNFDELFGNWAVYSYQINTSFGSVCIDGYKQYDKKVSWSVTESAGACPAKNSECFFSEIDDGITMYCKEGGKTKTLKCEPSDGFIDRQINSLISTDWVTLGEWHIYPL